MYFWAMSSLSANLILVCILEPTILKPRTKSINGKRYAIVRDISEVFLNAWMTLIFLRSIVN